VKSSRDDFKGHQIGVVIPTFKEAANIGNLLLEIRKFLPNSKIAVVDDSPDDQTVSAVRILNLDSLTLIHRQRKGGRGSAVLEGMNLLLEGDCKITVEMDADFSHPPNQLPELIGELCSRNLDLLIASRYKKNSRILNWPLSRRLFSRASNIFAKMLLKVPVSDYTNGYRVYSRLAVIQILESCGKIGGGFIALSEILVNLYYRDFKIGEVSTVFTNRLRGESSVTYSEVKSALIGIFKIYFVKIKLISKQ
jgi:dolichol-phosphate mannosyltransferase